uniref:Uncharacterized protein n=1 Tax=Oryza sativa subsp. japonica TaxID=39947 RepID=Q8H466_ORYSJ|nr:hypothetical protein [Oryza sativa Japonica Group]
MVSITISLGFFAGLDGDELLEEEERQVVIGDEHVAADVRHHVQRAVAAEHRVVVCVSAAADHLRRPHHLQQTTREHPLVNITGKNLSPRHSPARSTAATNSSTGLRGDGCVADGCSPGCGGSSWTDDGGAPLLSSRDEGSAQPAQPAVGLGSSPAARSRLRARPPPASAPIPPSAAISATGRPSASIPRPPAVRSHPRRRPPVGVCSSSAAASAAARRRLRAR